MPHDLSTAQKYKKCILISSNSRIVTIINNEIIHYVKIELEITDGNVTQRFVLEDGKKQLDNFQINSYKIYTYMHGSCYVIENTKEVGPWVTFDLFVKDLNSENGDKLSNINVFVASPETWYGIITLSWPFFELKQQSLYFNKLYWIDMKVTNISYQNGYKSIENCIENLMATHNGCKKCSPFFFFSKSKKLMSCQSIEDNKCWYHWSFYGKNYNEYKRCLIRSLNVP